MSGEEIFMISVIVPVYNTAGYVGRCIDSVLHSSCQDFELILVNDGSSDSSPEICREYCRRDSRIRLIGQEHEGVSAARNRGIEASRGEWIVFVDSDDFISDDFLGMVMQKENQGCELLIFDYALSKKKAGKRASRHTRAYREGGFRPIRYKETDRLKLVESLLYGRQIVGGGSTSLISPWAKAYKKSVIDQYSIRFPVDIVLGEDRIFNLEYFMRAESFTYVQKAVYFVEIRRNSATRRFRMDFSQNNLKYQEHLKKMLQRFGIFHLMEKAYYNIVLFGMADVLIKEVFHPYSPRSRIENHRLCQSMQKNKIYNEAMRYNRKMGGMPRRVLLFFYRIKCYGMVETICKISYRLLEWMEKL
ncbi:MAG: glycosyltransferase family 2 protein [Ruminococcus sp.]|nr:glycosyltransferase family 2 protein [Ruminococcus sp.]